MEEIKERELNDDEFSALNYIVNFGKPVDILEVNGCLVLKSNKFLDTILKVKLPANAVAYIKDLKEEYAEPEVIELLVRTDDGSYSATEYAKRYVEYYYDNRLNQ